MHDSLKETTKKMKNRIFPTKRKKKMQNSWNDEEEKVVGESQE
jgi:hypothetical protein